MKYASFDGKISAKMPRPNQDTLYFTADFLRPETFQTVSFGMNIYEANSNAEMKLTYPLVFGTRLPTKSVFGNAVLDGHYSYFFFSF